MASQICIEWEFKLDLAIHFLLLLMYGSNFTHKHDEILPNHAVLEGLKAEILSLYFYLSVLIRDVKLSKLSLL